MSTRWSRRAAGVVGGMIWDRVLGEPPLRWHPVAAFGTVMTGLERHVWADARLPGVGYAMTGAAIGAGAGALVGSVAVALGVCASGTEVRRVAGQIEAALRSGDLERARGALPSLVGRDPSELDESQICAAVIESLAENTVDAVIAPLLWAWCWGAPGAGAYRAINTMDAMVGHHSDRFEHFGWAAARADDVANYVPARVFALLVAMSTPSKATLVWRIATRDAAAHPSPNAGVAESAVAAALGLRLGGTLRYGQRVEHRPMLGEGSPPEPADVTRAIALTARTERLATLGAGLVAVVWPLASARGTARGALHLSRAT
ncbi:MAG: adenosylcobinamide-phosphate synthase CbiB [Ornithinimicrobium sp.]